MNRATEARSVSSSSAALAFALLVLAAMSFAASLPTFIADREHHLRACRRQGASGLDADARSCTGHDGPPAAEVDACAWSAVGAASNGVVRRERVCMILTPLGGKRGVRKPLAKPGSRAGSRRGWW